MSTQTDEQPTAAPDEAPEVIEGEVTHHPAPEPKIEGMSSEVKPDGTVVVRGRGGVLSIDPNQEKWTEHQRTGLRSIGIETEGPDAVPFSFVWQFLHMCQKTDLDPWLRECYLITHGKRFTKQSGEVVDNRKYTLVTGIDGFRKKAEDTAQYEGQIGPQWCGEDGVWKEFWSPKWGSPTAARVGILRRGFSEPVWGVAMYDEFVPLVDEYVDVLDADGRVQWERGRPKRDKTGKKVPTEMWQKMGANQLAKCAEAQGFRKTFPRTMAGMYEASEMQRAQADYEQQQADEQEKAQRARRSQARAAQAVTTGAEKPGPAEPVTVGDVVPEVVDAKRADSAAPAFEAPADAPDLPVRGDGGGDGGETPEPSTEPVAEVPEADRARLARAEVEFQAKTLGHDVSRIVMRFVRARKRNYEDFTAEEVLEVAAALRETVVKSLRAQGEGDVADAYERVEKGSYVDVDTLLADDEGSSTPESGEPVDPTAPHRYVDAGGICEVCEDIEDNILHS